MPPCNETRGQEGPGGFEVGLSYIRGFQKEDSGLPSLDLEKEILGGLDMSYNKSYLYVVYVIQSSQ